jgi:quercetin dioxygenase-like cupin family protein
MYETTIVVTEVPSVALDIPGVTVKLLHEGEARSGMFVLTRMDSGATIPEHWHTLADETVFVLDGDFVEAGVTHGPGTFFYGKAGAPHGPHTSHGGCTVLTHFSTAVDLDFNVVD